MQSSAAAAADGDIYSHWKAGFDQAASDATKPTLTFDLSAPVVVTHYSVMSANAHPSEDPKDWQFECRLGDFSSRASRRITS